MKQKIKWLVFFAVIVVIFILGSISPDKYTKNTVIIENKNGKFEHKTGKKIKYEKVKKLENNKKDKPGNKKIDIKIQKELIIAIICLSIASVIVFLLLIISIIYFILKVKNKNKIN